MKKKLLCIFGGRSVEHDVSVVTGLQAMDNLNEENYIIIPIYIAHDGKWYTGDKLRSIETFKPFTPSDAERCMLPPIPGEGLHIMKGKGLFGQKEEIVSPDAALLLMHGTHGEDGSLQGLLEMADIAYTSCSVGASAMCMDKIAMKTLFSGYGFPVLDAFGFAREEYLREPDKLLDMIEQRLNYPIYVKPASLGSSIGIGRADDREQMKAAIEVASNYDRRILAEQGVEDLIEINCSALGFGENVRASVCEQPISWQEFLTFEDKYMRGGKGSKSDGMASQQRRIPAPIPEELTREIQHMTRSIFKAFDCKGVVRIDYIIDNQTGELYVNELNSIPGSLAFYLWEPEGLDYPRLLDEMVKYALREYEMKHTITLTYDSGLLEKVGKGLTGVKK